eukprot:CAMPEP_0194698286 /NCGR_PEP_ID=MMETSP0295-20121207/23982_1 /TAXON_ID=39354 /ORGANISM="Heterosigma akashiwo, Strain CCMP2393" /LENGTH=344 /DNA_ID=CAMNT_0039591221 /DNA_START=382 /DNA_END=1411 /DNA_ORIENTATION=-
MGKQDGPILPYPPSVEAHAGQQRGFTANSSWAAPTGDQTAQNEASSTNSAGAEARDTGCISTESDREMNAGEVSLGVPGDQTAQNEASSTNSAGAEARDTGCISTESDREMNAGEVIGGGEQSTIVVDQLSAPENPELDELTLDFDNNMQDELSEYPELDELTLDLDNIQEFELNKSGVEMGVMENLSEIAPEAVGSAAAGRREVFDTDDAVSSISIGSIAGEEKEVEDDDNTTTDSESSRVHFDHANPYSLLGQDGEVGSAAAESEAKNADLGQQPSLGASAKIARDEGAMALSDEEVLEEAMVLAQQERRELKAKSSEDRGRGGGGRGGGGRGGGGRGGGGR